MNVIETGISKYGPYKAIKCNDSTKLNNLKNELFQQLGYSSISTEFKGDVLYVYFKKSVDDNKVKKLFTKYKVNESASEATLPEDHKSSFDIASQISLNIKGEYDAIEGYDKLIPWFEVHNDQESISIIREIISDEKNHVELLNKILMKYDDIEPAED